MESGYELRLGKERVPFRIEISGGQFDAAHSEAERPDATITADANTIAGVVFGGNPLVKAVESGDVEIDGSRRAVNALFRALT